MTAETARPARTDWTLPGLALADLTLPVPLDHADPASPRIERDVSGRLRSLRRYGEARSLRLPRRRV